MSSKEQILTLLKNSGFQILTDSVNDKRQNRNYHFKLQKDNVEYFAKASSVDDRERILRLQNEAETSNYLYHNIRNDKFYFPKYEVIDKDGIIIIYTKFVEGESVLSATKNGCELDENQLMNAVDEFLLELRNVSYSTILQIYKKKIKSPQERFLSLIDSMDVDKIYRGKEIKDKLLEYYKDIVEFEFAHGDLQFQNILWDQNLNKVVFVDLEHSRNMPLYWDFSHIYYLSKTNNSEEENFIERYLSKYLYTIKDIMKFNKYFLFNNLINSKYYLEHYQKSTDSYIKAKNLLDRFLDSRKPLS